jgi:hypothetical protein
MKYIISLILNKVFKIANSLFIFLPIRQTSSDRCRDKSLQAYPDPANEVSPFHIQNA